MDVFKNLVIITGANKGLGEALFNEIYSDKNINLIISVSRNLSLEQEKLLKNNDKRFRFIKVDLSKITNIKLSISSFEHFYKNYKNVTLISNAGIIGPIKKVGDYNDEEIIESINVNILSPVVVINYFINYFMNKNLKVVNISSKAVDSQIDGWATYSSAKMYMQKFIEMLIHQEKNNPDFNAINIYPGLIDTDMQKEIRGVTNKDFKKQKDFKKYKDDGQLQKPDIVAKKILNQLNY